MKTGIEYHIRSKSGKMKWVNDTVYSTLKYKKQGIRFGIMRDITKEKILIKEKENAGSYY
jgi:hypothetical protein